jgi:hypothetical protein
VQLCHDHCTVAVITEALTEITVSMAIATLHSAVCDLHSYVYSVTGCYHDYSMQSGYMHAEHV